MKGQNGSIGDLLDLKTCAKCKSTRPRTAEFFYRHGASKDGLTPRCKACVNEDNRRTHERRKAENPALIRAQANERAKRWYWENLEVSRERNRKHAAAKLKDPAVRAKINMRKRGGGAGMTADRFEALLAGQGGRCKICGTTEPGKKKGSLGWNIDHCHATGKVRFILCNACNRGLAAFKDRPDAMRRAADLIDEFLHSVRHEVDG